MAAGGVAAGGHGGGGRGGGWCGGGGRWDGKPASEAERQWMPKRPGPIPLDPLLRITYRGSTHVYTHTPLERKKECCKLCESMGDGRTCVLYECPPCGFPFHLDYFNEYPSAESLDEMRRLKHQPGAR